MSNSEKFAALRQIEASRARGDATASTSQLAAYAGNPAPVVCEANYTPQGLPLGTSAVPLSYNGQTLSSYLTTFDEGIAVFDIGVPLGINGTFFSHAFSHLRYPERYTHLFSKETDDAIRTIQQQGHRIKDAYVTLIRPPYYHWLLDTIPHLLGAAHLKQVDCIKLIAPDTMPLKVWQKELLERAAKSFGFSNVEWHPLTGNIVGVQPGYSQTRMPMGERVEVVRSLGPRTNSQKPWRFLYAKRSSGDIRQLKNEADVLQALDERFEVIEPGQLDVETQMQVFSEAQCVVGVHGSNLTNITFCQPGTAVVEIAAGLYQPHFERVCREAQLCFERVAGVPTTDETQSTENSEVTAPTWAQAHGDLTVEPAHILEAIERAIESDGKS